MFTKWISIYIDKHNTYWIFKIPKTQKEKLPKEGFYADTSISFHEGNSVYGTGNLFKNDISDPRTGQVLMAAHGQSIISGACQLPLEGRLNGRYPEFSLMTVEELLPHA